MSKFRFHTVTGYLEEARFLIRKQDPFPAVSLLLEAHERWPENTEIISRLAFAYMASQQAKKAVNLLKTSIKRLPPSPKLYDMLATVYYYIGDKKKFEQAYKKRIELEEQGFNENF